VQEKSRRPRLSPSHVFFTFTRFLGVFDINFEGFLASFLPPLPHFPPQDLLVFCHEIRYSSPLPAHPAIARHFRLLYTPPLSSIIGRKLVAKRPKRPTFSPVAAVFPPIPPVGKGCCLAQRVTYPFFARSVMSLPNFTPMILFSSFSRIMLVAWVLRTCW